MGRQDPPPMPVIRETEDGNTSSAQPNINHGQSSALTSHEKRKTFHDFDLNIAITGEGHNEENNRNSDKNTPQSFDLNNEYKFDLNEDYTGE